MGLLEDIKEEQISKDPETNNYLTKKKATMFGEGSGDRLIDVYKKSGSPDIRVRGDGLFDKFLNFTIGKNTSMFNPITNTIYSQDNSINNVIEELSHAYRLKQGVDGYGTVIGDWITKDAWNWITGNKGYNPYDDNSHFETQTHDDTSKVLYDYITGRKKDFNIK